jgi:hypothetical protein
MPADLALQFVEAPWLVAKRHHHLHRPFVPSTAENSLTWWQSGNAGR